jgi:hypothetical protein
MCNTASVRASLECLSDSVERPFANQARVALDGHFAFTVQYMEQAQVH